MNQDQAERAARELLRKILANAAIGAKIDSVRLIDRETPEEFATIKLWAPEQMDQYDRVLEILTAPGCPLRVTRERTGRRDHFIYLAR